MTLISSAEGGDLRPVPDLGAIAPWMLTAAFFAHLIVWFLFFANPPATDASAGGGGKVLGQFSMTLVGAVASEAITETEETTTDRVREPVFDQKMVQRALPTPTRPPVVRQPASRQTVLSEAARQSPAQTAPPPAKPVGGKPAPAAQAASPTLGTGAAAPVPGDGSGISKKPKAAAYLALVRQRIEENRRYPASARRRGIEGTTVLTIVIAADGRVSQLDMRKGSGSFDLDRAAKRMVSAAEPFPRPPNAPYSVVLPVSFQLGG